MRTCRRQVKQNTKCFEKHLIYNVKLKTNVAFQFYGKYEPYLALGKPTLKAIYKVISVCRLAFTIADFTFFPAKSFCRILQITYITIDTCDCTWTADINFFPKQLTFPAFAKWTCTRVLLCLCGKPLLTSYISLILYAWKL